MARESKEDRTNSAIYVFIDRELSESERSRAATVHVCRGQMQLHDHGFSLAAVDLIFMDFGGSSSECSDRPARRQLLHCVAQGKIDVVAVASIEQLGATPDDRTAFCAECQAMAVEVFAPQLGRVRLKIANPEERSAEDHRHRDDAEPDRSADGRSDEAGRDRPASGMHASIGTAPRRLTSERASSQVLGPMVELFVAGYDSATVADILNVLDLPTSDRAVWTPVRVKSALSDIVRNSIHRGEAPTTRPLSGNGPGKASSAIGPDSVILHPRRIGLLAKKLAAENGRPPRFHAADRRCSMFGYNRSVRRRRGQIYRASQP